MAVNLAAAGNIAISGSGGITISSIISGTNGLTKSGTGTGVLSLSGTNTFTGGVTVNGGILSMGSNGALNSGNNALAMGGGTLRLNTFSTSVTALSGASGTINNNSTGTSTLTVNQSTTTTYSGVLANGAGAGTLALTKSGAGSLTLAGANTYTGATSVSTGTLSVTGSIASATTVSGTGTLSGTGTVAGVTLNSGGTLSPGVADAGTLTGSSLTWNGGASAIYELGATNAASDLFTMSGAFTKGTAGTYAFNISNAGITNHMYKYTLMSFGSRAGWANNASDFTSTGIPGTFSFEGNNLTFQATLPEPGTFALAGLGLVGGLILRRRRK